MQVGDVADGLMVRRYEAVFFDAGGTLLWNPTAADEIFCRALREYGIEVVAEEGLERPRGNPLTVSRTDVHTAVDATMKAFRKTFPTKEEQPSYFRRFDTAVLQRLGIDPHPDLLEAIARRFEADVRPEKYDDVDPTLEALVESGYRLGVISNATHELPERLEALGIAAYFDAITYSWEVGEEKPSTRIFEVALGRLSASRERSVHVGDSYEADVVGSRAVGMTPMLIDRQGSLRREDCIVLRSLLEILDHL